MTSTVRRPIIMEQNMETTANSEQEGEEHIEEDAEDDDEPKGRYN